MQQVVSRARGIICGETERWPQFVRASRGASRARAQACALVTPARLARGVGGAERAHQEMTGAAGGVGPSRQETTGAVGSVGPSRQETMGAVGAPHAPKPLLQLAVCARSPGTTRAAAVREVPVAI